MLDRIALMGDKIAYWKDRELDNPYHLNGFVGEFNFQDHDRVPEEVQNLVMHSTKHERFRQVPIATVNKIAREVHGGKPGFIIRAWERILELQQLKALAREDSDSLTNSKNVYENELTIDDWSGDTNDRKTELDT